jgi:hypothetical protein
VPTIATGNHCTMLLAIATTLGCAGYLETADDLAPECDDHDAGCRDAPERGVLVVPEAREVPAAATPKEPAEPSLCPAGTREVRDPEGSCGAVLCEPIPPPKRR